MAIKVTNDVDHYFETKKGLYQGDHMSSMLFNIVTSWLPLECAKQDDQIAGVVRHLVDVGLSIMQYACNTIPFMEDDLDKA